MLFMHEVHTVRGRAEDDFEAAFRDGWMPMLGTGDDARLLWYTNHAHGSGPAYTVVTVTAVRDGTAWERLALRIQKGDLRKWMRDLDELRHDVDAKLLVPLAWSPLKDVDFDDVPTDGREHDDGYIYPSGRLKNTINRGGEKFGPIEVEDAIRTHPAVSDVAVAGIADEEMGQRVGAAVVARSPLTLEELRSHCRDLIAYFKLPERMKVVDHIPYNDTGKVNRRQLAALIDDAA